jgi:hypothetical protein
VAASTPAPSVTVSVPPIVLPGLPPLTVPVLHLPVVTLPPLLSPPTSAPPVTARPSLAPRVATTLPITVPGVVTTPGHPAANRAGRPAVAPAMAPAVGRASDVTPTVPAVQLVARSVRALSLPLGPAVVVGMFLVLQGRIDRRDPKLVDAPTGADDDLVEFA